MIENEPPLNNTDEMINNFIEECEREAAKLEITVDYYIAEFVVGQSQHFLLKWK